MTGECARHTDQQRVGRVPDGPRGELIRVRSPYRRVDQPRPYQPPPAGEEPGHRIPAAQAHRGGCTAQHAAARSAASGGSPAGHPRSEVGEYQPTARCRDSVQAGQCRVGVSVGQAGQYTAAQQPDRARQVHPTPPQAFDRARFDGRPGTAAFGVAACLRRAAPRRAVERRRRL